MTTISSALQTLQNLFWREKNGWKKDIRRPLLRLHVGYNKHVKEGALGSHNQNATFGPHAKCGWK